jgi:cytochrome o ubiquinol oxidase subunit 2
MSKKNVPIIAILLTAVAVVVALFVIKWPDLAILHPKGDVGIKERNLFIFTTLLALLVVIPVYILTIAIVWRYRAGNHKATYKPEWDHNTKLETIWWGIPCTIIFILAVVAWTSSHELDPFKPLQTSKKPVTIQVVAMQWKWLFIYPEQHIATVNYLEIPEKTPINFEITSDAPMNSFWIPKLGGQIYAMSGMTTHLHLIANEQGVYSGSSANISGKGFADMRFNVRASSEQSFTKWVQTVRNKPDQLTQASYAQLAKPGTMRAKLFGRSESGLYDTVVMKYMTPQTSTQGVAEISQTKVEHE